MSACQSAGFSAGCKAVDIVGDTAVNEGNGDSLGGVVNSDGESSIGGASAALLGGDDIAGQRLGVIGQGDGDGLGGVVSGESILGVVAGQESGSDLSLDGTQVSSVGSSSSLVGSGGDGGGDG